MLTMLAVLGLFSAGCSGINARGTVSPAMLLIKAGPLAAADTPVFAFAPPQPSGPPR
jgi:hypothetical protein